MQKSLFNPKEIISEFDKFLGSKNLRFEAVAIGGAALVFLDIINRSTRDVDLLETEIPSSIQEAAKSFAVKRGISEFWFNAGPADLIGHLPNGWEQNLQPLYRGKNLTLKTLSRIDLIRTKLWAMCDRMRDIDDLIAIDPNDEEIAIAIEWVIPLDGNPAWPDHVNNMAQALKKRLDRE